MLPKNFLQQLLFLLNARSRRSSVTAWVVQAAGYAMPSASITNKKALVKKFGPDMMQLASLGYGCVLGKQKDSYTHFF